MIQDGQTSLAGGTPGEDEMEDEEPPLIPASSLPHEILLHILRLLPPTALAPALRVCKAWCQCGVELLWHKPMFTSLPALYKMLQILGQTSTQTFPYPEFVKRINFSNLTEEMSDKLLGKLAPCTRIERLTLTGCKHLTSESMIKLLEKSTKLVALDLSEVEEVDDQVITALAENCPRLQGLNLTGCGKVTDVGIEKLAKGCPALRRIKLRKCDLITDVSIILLSLHCPLLLEVDLGLCLGISSVSLQQLLRTSHSLRELCLNGCSSLTDEGFPDATSLSLITSSARHSSSYSSAQASPLPSGSDTSSNNASRPSSPGPSPLRAPSGQLVRKPLPLSSPPPLHSFDHLRYLDLTSLALLTDQAIAGIVKFMPKIRNLILAKCTRLTDESLYEICKVGKHLHYLHLGHVNSITDKAVTAIAKSCTRLRYIDLACCNNLTDVSVLELAQNLPRLKRIGLVRVTNITDASLDALHARTSLERIHLSYCSNLTVAGVNDLLQHLPRLTHLSLTEVQAFRKKALQVFCRPPPKDFNDHQRRSFCVFSGRGVHELRRYLRSLSPEELEALAQPDPPSDDDAARLVNRGLGGQNRRLGQQNRGTVQQNWGFGQDNRGAGQGTMTRIVQRSPGGGLTFWQGYLQLDEQANETAGGGEGEGGASDLGQARTRLAQLARTQPGGRVGDATVEVLHPISGDWVPPGLGSAFDPSSSPTTDAIPDQRRRLPLPGTSDPFARAIQAFRASRPLLSSRPQSTPTSASRNGVAIPDEQEMGGFGRPRLDRQNSLGLSGPIDLEVSDRDDEDEGMQETIPIQSVPATNPDSMDLDETRSRGGPSNIPATRPARHRRDTVTRTNYRTVNAFGHNAGGRGMDDEDGDEDGEATGDEEDLTMG